MYVYPRTHIHILTHAPLPCFTLDGPPRAELACHFCGNQMCQSLPPASTAGHTITSRPRDCSTCLLLLLLPFLLYTYARRWCVCNGEGSHQLQFVVMWLLLVKCRCIKWQKLSVWVEYLFILEWKWVVLKSFRLELKNVPKLSRNYSVASAALTSKLKNFEMLLSTWIRI